jgi:hypothetical protein
VRSAEAGVPPGAGAIARPAVRRQPLPPPRVARDTVQLGHQQRLPVCPSSSSHDCEDPQRLAGPVAGADPDADPVRRHHASLVGRRLQQHSEVDAHRLQPFAIPHLPGVDELANCKGFDEFIDDADSLGWVTKRAVEWLRSRLPNHPRLLVPHIEKESPQSDWYAFMGDGFPWSHAARQTGLQFEGPPGVPEGLALDDERIADCLKQLWRTLETTERWKDFAIAARGLSAADDGQLSGTRWTVLTVLCTRTTKRSNASINSLMPGRACSRNFSRGGHPRVSGMGRCRRSDARIGGGVGSRRRMLRRRPSMRTDSSPCLRTGRVCPASS